MAQYIISYLGGNLPANAEEANKHFSQYKDWLASLDEAIVSAANPLKDTQTVNPDGTISPGSTTAMSGFTIIKADSMEIALEYSKSCPFLNIGGTLEVSELMQLVS